MPQDLHITAVLNGWIVKAGCQTLVFSDAKVITSEFREWLDHPLGVENRYRELARRKGFTPEVPAMAPPPAPTNSADVADVLRAPLEEFPINREYRRAATDEHEHGSIAETERSPAMQDRIAQGRVQ